MKYTQISSFDAPELRGYRFVWFFDDVHGNAKSKRLKFLDFLEFLSHPTHYWWRVYMGEDGKRWKLTRTYVYDVPEGQLGKVETVLKGVSLCYLACWVAKEYRNHRLDEAVFVEECQA